MAYNIYKQTHHMCFKRILQCRVPDVKNGNEAHRNTVDLVEMKRTLKLSNIIYDTALH